MVDTGTQTRGSDVRMQHAGVNEESGPARNQSDKARGRGGYAKAAPGSDAAISAAEAKASKASDTHERMYRDFSTKEQVVRNPPADMTAKQRAAAQRALTTARTRMEKSFRDAQNANADLQMAKGTQERMIGDYRGAKAKMLELRAQIKPAEKAAETHNPFTVKRNQERLTQLSHDYMAARDTFNQARAALIKAGIADRVDPEMALPGGAGSGPTCREVGRRSSQDNLDAVVARAQASLGRSIGDLHVQRAQAELDQQLAGLKSQVQAIRNSPDYAQRAAKAEADLNANPALKAEFDALAAQVKAARAGRKK